MKTINIILIISLAFMGLYSIALVSHILDFFAVIIFYIPPVVIIVMHPVLAGFINGLLVAVIILSIIATIDLSIENIDNSRLYVGEFLALTYMVTIIASYILPPSPPRIDIRIVPSVIVWAPIYEEMFFRVLIIIIPLTIASRDRGLLIHGKETIERKDYALIAISSLLFGLGHIYGGIGLLLIATLVGMFLGYLCLRYGILSSICMHFLLNATTASWIVARTYHHATVLMFLNYALYMLILTASILTVIHVIRLHLVPQLRRYCTQSEKYGVHVDQGTNLQDEANPG